jgi:hypothetical protein
MSKNGTASQKYWLIVIELDDLMPRRDPSKPNLYVTRSSTPPEKRFEIIQKGKKTHWYTNHIVQLRPDLAPAKAYKSREDVKTACAKLVKKLRSQGFTVNRNTQVWNVYVIELDETAVTNPGHGYVYVGETSRTPEERFKQHRDGARNKKGRLYANVVKKHGVKLRPDLAPDTKFFDQASAKRGEKERFELLKSKGFNVKGGR